MSTVDVVLKRIKQLRIESKYSLEDVAKGIGYETAKGYYDLESGKTSIKLEHLDRLSKFYKIPIGFFFKQDSTKKVHDGNYSSIPDKQPALPNTG